MDEENKIAQTAEAEAAAENAEPPKKQRRRRRTKAEMEADAKKAAEKAKRGAQKAAKAAEDAIETVAKAAARARVPAPEIIVQYAGNEVNAGALADAAIAQFRTEKKRTKISDFKLYVKPEERAAYYVINDEYTGKVEF